jgi:hypothetical protein
MRRSTIGLAVFTSALLLLTLAPSIAVAQYPVTVYAQSNNVADPDGLRNDAWQWAFLCVDQGDLLIFDASGTWTDGDNVSGPAGVEKFWPDNFLNLNDLGVGPYEATTHTPYHNALVGYLSTREPGPYGLPSSSPPARGSYAYPTDPNVVRLDAQRVFPVFPDDVTPSYFQVMERGCLWLAFNADAYSNYTVDNSGQVEVTITHDSGWRPCPDVGLVCNFVPGLIGVVCDVANQFVNGC